MAILHLLPTLLLLLPQTFATPSPPPFPHLLTLSHQLPNPVLPLLRTPQTTTPYAGNTFDLCVKDSDCKSPRSCRTLGNQPCPPGGTCFCYRQTGLFQFCLKPSDCPKPEICVQASNRLRKVCISPAALKFTIFSDPGPASTKIGDGFTFAKCSSDKNCKDDRTCNFFYGEPFSTPCNSRKPCFCDRPSNVLCFTSEDCPSGEVCANTPVTRVAICVSKNEVRTQTSLSEVPSTLKNTDGYTLDPCRGDKDCRGDRTCRLYNNILPPCNGKKGCICLPPRSGCTSTGDCIPQEVCAKTPLLTNALCMSTDARASDTGIQTVVAPFECPVLIKGTDPPAARFVSMPVSRVGEVRVDNVEQAEYYEEDVDATGRVEEEDLHIDESVNIVGGRAASGNLLPYLVAITNAEGRSLCTGVLMSKRWVLTAAHCKTAKGYVAGFGARRAFNGSMSTNIRVVRVFEHPKFEVTPGDFLFDIAVFELASDAPGSARFMKLNAKKGVPGDNTVVRSIGYGRTQFGVQGDPILRQVDTKIVPNGKCSMVYQEGTIDGIAIDARGQVCAGIIPRGGCGICQGDSGGPLIQYEKGMPIVLGLASFGVRCGDWRFPGVFARVSNYVDWIKSSTPAVFTTNTGKSTGVGDKKCKKGEFLAGKKCKACSKTSVSPGGSVGKCKPCSNGFVRDSRDGSKCSCVGRFAVGKGEKGGKCQVCRKGSFAGKKDKVCRKCPKGTSSGKGASKCK